MDHHRRLTGRGIWRFVAGAGAACGLLASTLSGTTTAAAGTPVARYDLGPGQELRPGAYLTMAPYHMLMKKDGNLVVNDGSRIIWQTATAGNPGAYAVMQQDGNFVVYSGGGTPLWDTGAAGPGTCLMGSATNGRMVVDTPGDVYGWWPLWSLAPCYKGHGPKVAVLGDSITDLDQRVFPSILAPHYAYEVSGMVGFTFADQLPAELALLHNPRTSPRDLIIDLGSNDVVYGVNDWQTGLDALLDNVGDRCTLLVTLSYRADADAIDPSDHLGPAINAYFRDWTRQHHNVHVLPWGKLLKADNYSWVVDGLHPNAAGDQALAELFVRYLRADCGS